MYVMQTAMESTMVDQYKKMLLAFHQQVWCWMDEWYGLTMEDVRKLEQKTKEELKDKIKEDGKRGTTDLDA